MEFRGFSGFFGFSGMHLPRLRAAQRELRDATCRGWALDMTKKHKNRKKLDEAAHQLVVLMRKSFGSRVLGPEYPAISRIRNYYHKNVLLKIEDNASITEAKNILQTIVGSMKEHVDFKGIRFILDIDPV